ncbi:hypothetical protein D3C71_2117950 [compost metagenome]
MAAQAVLTIATVDPVSTLSRMDRACFFITWRFLYKGTASATVAGPIILLM